MPFYEYLCEQCGKEFEVFVKTMDAPAPLCEECGSTKVARKLSVFGVSSAQPTPPSPCGGCPSGGSCPMAQG